VLRTLVVYGGTTTVIVVADIMRGTLSNPIIARIISLEAVGVFGIAFSINQYISSLVATGMGVLTPRFSGLDARGDHPAMRQLLLKSLALSSFLSFGACMAAIVLGRAFILWWVGDTFSASAPVLSILSVACAFGLSQNPAIMLMYALNKHKFYAMATVVEAVLNVALSIVFAYRYGLNGVALGTLIPMLIVKVLIMPVYVSKVSGIPIGQYLRPMMPGAIAATALTLAATWTGLLGQLVPGIGPLVGAGTIIGVVYVALYSLIALRESPDCSVTVLLWRVLYPPSVGLLRPRTADKQILSAVRRLL
jgi:O-antigen/teichoic acid export membrane protein